MRAASWWRWLTPSLVKALARWYSTVLGLRYSCCAASRLDSPDATSPRHPEFLSRQPGQLGIPAVARPDTQCTELRPGGMREGAGGEAEEDIVRGTDGGNGGLAPAQPGQAAAVLEVQQAAVEGEGVPGTSVAAVPEYLLGLLELAVRHTQQAAQPRRVEQRQRLAAVGGAKNSNAARIVSASRSWPVRISAQICSGRHQKAAGSS